METTGKEVDDWFTTRKIILDVQLKEKEEMEAKRLLYSWRDTLASQIEEMLVTDLVEHQIPLYPEAQLRCAKRRYMRRWNEINCTLIFHI